MAKKKTSPKEKEQEEKPKPLDRTQIIVAIIGLIGTIIVASVTFLANRSTDSAPPGGTVTRENGVVTSAVDAPASSPNDGACFGGYFASVPSQNQADLQAGVAKRISGNDGIYGVRLFDSAELLGGMIFVGTASTESFSATSVVDETCSPVTDFWNLNRPNANGAIGNWEYLGMWFSEGNYRMRMGWYGSSEIELLFAANP